MELSIERNYCQMEYKQGDIVLGTVSGIQPYGAFIKLDNSEQGLIHISEISSYFVKNIEDYVQIGQKIKIKVLEVLEDKKLYRFSLKQVGTRYRQNVRNFKSINPKKRYKIPLDQQDFTPLEENLDRWIDEELIKIGEEKND